MDERLPMSPRPRASNGSRSGARAQRVGASRPRATRELLASRTPPVPLCPFAYTDWLPPPWATRAKEPLRSPTHWSADSVSRYGFRGSTGQSDRDAVTCRSPCDSAIEAGARWPIALGFLRQPSVRFDLLRSHSKPHRKLRQRILVRLRNLAALDASDLLRADAFEVFAPESPLSSKPSKRTAEAGVLLDAALLGAASRLNIELIENRIARGLE